MKPERNFEDSAAGRFTFALMVATAAAVFAGRCMGVM